MRRFYFYLSICTLLLSFTITVQKPCTSYILKGSVRQAEGGWVQISRNDYMGFQFVDSASINNGRVQIKLPFAEPTVIRLEYKGKIAITFLNCGSNSFEWNLGKDGSFRMADNDIDEYNRLFDSSVANPSREKLIEINGLKSKYGDGTKEMDSLDELNKKVSEDYFKETMAFIRAHKDNFTALYYLRRYFQEFPIDSVKVLYALLNKELKQYPASNTLKDFLQVEGSAFKLENLDFITGFDSIAGYRFYLIQVYHENSSNRFCTECIPEYEQLKRLYAKYHHLKGLQLVSIIYKQAEGQRLNYSTLGESATLWPFAGLQGGRDKKTLVDELYLNALPAYLLLDSSQKILFRGNGEAALAAIESKLQKR